MHLYGLDAFFFFEVYSNYDCIIVSTLEFFVLNQYKIDFINYDSMSFLHVGEL
jgi:hypothetical protein